MNLRVEVENEVLSLKREEKIPIYTKFFRASEGDICEGDMFLGLQIPSLRKLIKKYYSLINIEDIEYFLNSKYNEMRFFGQQIIRLKYEKTKDLEEKERLINFMISQIKSINHWNLVDGIAFIFSDFAIITNDFENLEKFNNSESVWQNRMGIVALFPILKTKNETYFNYIYNTLELNKTRKHEYIKKALGWFLREMGKTNEKFLITYLKENWQTLSSITKSYATEKLRKSYDIKLLFEQKN
jgi:3-methyladenine DNA glycosylase AlkD